MYPIFPPLAKAINLRAAADIISRRMSAFFMFRHYTLNNINAPDLITTKDGSHTLYSNRFRQHYHNSCGAVAENKHVFFIQNGLKEALVKQERINVLEIGFGTGLNLLLLMDEYLKCGSTAQIHYHTIEAYPISDKTASILNYAEHLHHPELAEKLPLVFDSLQKGMNMIEMLPNINTTVFYGLFENYSPEEIQFNFILHDAFSPEANPELWTGEVFQKLKKWSAPEALLSTYCAASKARAAMAWAGWKVARAHGAPGKREMTVASLSAEPLSHLKRLNEVRLAKRYESKP